MQLPTNCEKVIYTHRVLGSKEEEEVENEEVSLRIEKVIKKVRINRKSHPFIRCRERGQNKSGIHD